MNASPGIEAPAAEPRPEGLPAHDLLEAVGDGVALLHRDASGISIEWASGRFAAAFGRERAQLIGRSAAAIDLRRGDGSPLPLAALFLAASGSTPVAIRAIEGERGARASWRALDGRTSKVLLTLTELQPLDPACRADSAATFDSIASYLRYLITVCDVGGTIRGQYGAREVAGRDPAGRRGGTVFDFIHPDDVPRMRSWLARLAAVETGASIEDAAVQLLHGDGRWRVVRVRGTNLLPAPSVRGLVLECHFESDRTLAELAADQTRDQLREAAEGVRVGFFEYDVAADTVEISDECYLMRGFSPPAEPGPLRGDALRQSHPQDEAAVRDGLERLIVGPENEWDAEFRQPAQPGDWIWVHQRVSVLERDPSGRARRIVGILFDVDRRKRAERGLARSEARYRTVVAMSPGFVHESAMNSDGKLMFQWASEGFTRILGWTIDEVNERGGFRSIVHPDYRAAAAARRADALSGEPVRGETRLLAKSGEYVWFAVSAFPLQEPETGRIVSMMGSLHEITGLKLAEERVKASEERFRLATEAVSGIIYERDISTGGITCTGSAVDALGYGQDARYASLDWWRERIHPDDAASLPGDRIDQDDDRRIVERRYRVRDASGRYIDLLDRAVRFRNEAGDVVRLVGCAMDVSRERRAERLLSEAEALAHVGSWELDLKRQELIWSDEAYRIHRTSRALFKPSLESLTSFYAPESEPVIRAAIQRAMATGEGFDLELEIVTRDGERRWLRTNGRIERSGDEPLRLYGSFQDIDALKRSEKRIREQSDRLRLVLDAAQMLAWRWHPLDDRLVVEYRSPSFDQDIPIGRTMTEDLADAHPDDRDRIRRMLERAAVDGQPSEFEFRCSDLTGRMRWLAGRLIPAQTPDGPVVVGTTHEITARRSVEEALRASEAVLRSVSENSPDFIVVTDSELRVVFVNRGVRGQTLAAALRQPFAVSPSGELLDPDQWLRGVLADGRPVRFESSVRGADGEEILFENRVGPVEQGGQVTGVIVYSTDITDRRALEREILEVSNREQRRIGSDLHDGLGQELTGIALMLRGLASALERGAPPAADALEEVLALVNAAIDTTRTLARGLSPVALEGGGLVDALRALAARAREMYGLDVRFRSRVSPRVTLDAAATGHLYRIAQESLTNTARHAHAKSVLVQFTVRGRRVSLSVTDDGRGLAAGSGTGMGLKIMRYRAHMLGGELQIEPAPEGHGTRVACTVLQPEPEPAAEFRGTVNS
jgi:PAS domain S-box-containing protein